MIEHGTYTDPRDNCTYKIVRLRDGKWWLAENLRFESKDSFPSEQKPQIEFLKTYPEYDATTYGRLYTQGAAASAAPPGFRLPSDSDWRKLFEKYGGHAEHGQSMPTSTRNDLLSLIDELRVTFGGALDSIGGQGQDGSLSYTYFRLKMSARFWTSSTPLLDRKNRYYFVVHREITGTPVVERIQENPWMAFSVRCVKNS